MHKKILRPALFVALLILVAAALPAAPADLNRLEAAQAAAIEKIFENHARTDRPGCALGIARSGETVYTRGFGMANLEDSVAITPDTVFEAGSVSKQFTAAAMLLLEKQGKLALDDDIRKYLPEVPDFGQRITLRNLLTHTSGLREQWVLLAMAGRPPGSAVHTLEEILQLVGRQKELNFVPGTEYLYCNTGYSLLTLIARRAGGRSLAEFSQAELFQPLGMNRTQWRDDHTRLVKNRAAAYSGDGAGNFRNNMPFTNVYGSGGLLTTVGDLLTWNQMFWNPRVLDPALLDRMQTPGSLAGGEAIDYGLGLILGEHKGLREISHGGATAGYRTYLLRFPVQQLSLALLCNSGSINSESLAHQVVDVLLAGEIKARPRPAAVPVSEQELQNRAGLYRNPATDAILRLTLKEGKLLPEGAGNGNDLIPVDSQTHATAAGVRFRFENRGNGQPRELRVIPLRGQSTLYISVPEANPTPEQLQEFCGSYFSEELGVAYQVVMAEGKLALQLPPEAPQVYIPTYLDAFSSADRDRQIRFSRDSSGKINGFRVFAGRVRHLRFTRRPA